MRASPVIPFPPHPTTHPQPATRCREPPNPNISTNTEESSQDGPLPIPPIKAHSPRNIPSSFSTKELPAGARASTAAQPARHGQHPGQRTCVSWCLTHSHYRLGGPLMSRRKPPAKTPARSPPHLIPGWCASAEAQLRLQVCKWKSAGL